MATRPTLIRRIRLIIVIYVFLCSIYFFQNRDVTLVAKLKTKATMSLTRNQLTYNNTSILENERGVDY